MPDLSHVITHLEQHTPRTSGNPAMHAQFVQALALLKATHAHDADAFSRALAPDTDDDVDDDADDPSAEHPTDPNDQEPSDG